MIYNKKYLFGLHLVSGTKLLNFWNFLSDKGVEGVFC